MPSSSASSATFSVTSEEYQFGRMANPGTIIKHGYPSDSMKKTVSGRIYMTCADTLELIQSTEAKAQADAPEYKLNSSIVEMLPDNGYIVRYKCTRDSSKFQPDICCPHLTDLKPGCQLVAKVRSVAWKRNGETGCTIYFNYVCCTGEGVLPNEAQHAPVLVLWD